MDQYELFKSKIHAMFGLDLNKYKDKQLRRRILQFMAKHETESFQNFTKMLTDNPELSETFKDYITINTSEFFRDIKVFDYFKKEVMPALATKGTPIKIWSAGCSIGAEAYSLAILCKEANLRNFHIVATDFDCKVLEKGKIGSYNANLLKNVPVELLPKYFSSSGEKYTINTEIKKFITFKEHNLLATPFPRDFDMILCRNVFIYFVQEVQQQLIAGFAQSLKERGFFIVGASEFISLPENYGLKKLFYSAYQKR